MKAHSAVLQYHHDGDCDCDYCTAHTADVWVTLDRTTSITAVKLVDYSAADAMAVRRLRD